MIHLRKLLFLIIVFVFPSILNIEAAEIRPCSIKDKEKHQKNKELLASIIKEELSTLNSTPLETSLYLSKRIDQVANKLIHRGFNPEAYEVPEINHDKAAAFNCFALWEGAEQTLNSIPITFFIYIWPSEKISQQYHGENYHLHKSNIHRHPISCALSVLHGSLSQRSFCCINLQSKEVKILKTDIFKVGEGDVDDLKGPFIHELCNKSNEPMTLSLHAYGLATELQVRNCFEETFSECSFSP